MIRLTELPDIVGIVGSRGPDYTQGRRTGWTNYGLVFDLCFRIQAVRHESGSPATIVSGGAPTGVDRHVRIACRNLGFEMNGEQHDLSDPEWVRCRNDHFHEFPAKWRGPDGKVNRHAGMERNDKLVRHCGLVLALFADGPRTPGTSDVIRRCAEYEIPVLVYHGGTWT